MTSNINIKQRGFTIVELLIVIVVIAILAAISIGLYVGVQQSARDSQRGTDVNSISKGIGSLTTQEDFSWADLATVAGAQAELSGAETVKTPQDIIDKLSASVPSASATNIYGYRACEAGTGAGVTGTPTGVVISWFNEADDAVRTSEIGDVGNGASDCNAYV